MKSHKISIVIPVYNVEDYIDECVESVITQTYTNLEIILIDDGSTDKSGEICEELAKRDDRIIVIHKDNGGQSDARNAGLEVATGEYIGFVDADDYIEPDMYEVLLDGLLGASEHSISCIRYEEVGEQRRELPPADGLRKTISIERYFYDILSENYKEHATYSPCTRLYSSNDIKGIKFPKGKIFEDLLFTTKVLSKVHRCVYINKICYNYRKRKKSTTYIENGVMDAKMVADILEMNNESIQYLHMNNLRNLEMMSRAYMFRTLLYFKANYKDSCLAPSINAYIQEYKLPISTVFAIPEITNSDKVKISASMLFPGLLCARYKRRQR